MKKLIFVLYLLPIPFETFSQTATLVSGTYTNKISPFEKVELILCNNTLTGHYYKVFINSDELSEDFNTEEFYIFGKYKTLLSTKTYNAICFSGKDIPSDLVTITFINKRLIMKAKDTNDILFSGVLKKRDTLWKELRVLNKKTFLYDKKDVFLKRKSYLLKGDYVKILQQNNKWVNIEYKNLRNDKVTQSWIPIYSLYPLNPSQWK